MAGIGFPPRRSMAAENIRDLQRRARHARGGLGGRRLLGLVLLDHQRSEAIQRAHDLADRVGSDVGIKRRGLKLGVSKRSCAIMRILLSH
jgi:hypothetical protein